MAFRTKLAAPGDEEDEETRKRLFADGQIEIVDSQKRFFELKRWPSTNDVDDGVNVEASLSTITSSCLVNKNWTPFIPPNLNFRFLSKTRIEM